MAFRLLPKVSAPTSMSQYMKLVGPNASKLDSFPLKRWAMKLVWNSSKRLWSQKDPAAYMVALAKIVLATEISDDAYSPTAYVQTAHKAMMLTDGFQTLARKMENDLSVQGSNIFTVSREMMVAEFRRSEEGYVSMTAHSNYHAVFLWIMGQFASGDPKGMPEANAGVNHSCVVYMLNTWTLYLESLLALRLGPLKTP